ncbi:transglycosylase SLT domain-containing protein [Streptomyces sp. NPDC006012]|uniref:transglycosylase SLT domain-containing protein n=1 Tax=Streptomyces sp. NPDC006012 TaxID=3364739 RepID=UPI00368CE929
MPKNIVIRGHDLALTKQHRIAIAGVSAIGVAAVAFTAVSPSTQTVTTAAPVSTAHVAYSNKPIQDVKSSVTDQLVGRNAELDSVVAHQKADAAVYRKADAGVKQEATEQHTAQKAASRSAQRVHAQPAAAKKYRNNLDGWIRQSLDIMRAKGIPGSYSGLHRNIMRESSGNPNAINNWDINAINGIPSKGLLQVIPPTFRTYHVKGTSWNIYNPVANITAAANYAAHRYGSIDNVNSAY